MAEDQDVASIAKSDRPQTEVGEGATPSNGTVNERFAEAVTNQAFALTLSKAMVWGLSEVVAAADAGRHYFANSVAFSGLERRGLVAASVRSGHEVSPEIGWAPRANPVVIVWLPTLAGRLVLELCRQAGLQPNPAADTLLDAMKERQAALAVMERECTAHQEQRHAEVMDRIKLKPTYSSGEPA